MLDVLLNDTDAIAVRAADGPELALGFSNGAGMASMMGCFDSTDIYAAHVAVHIDKDATFDATCAGNLVNGDKRERELVEQRELPVNPDKPVWMATGEADFFIDGVGVQGLWDQFDTWCTDTPTELDTCSSDCTTFDCEVCPSNEGELCVYYDGIGHEMAPSMTYLARKYLIEVSGNFQVCADSCPPSDGDGGGGGDTCTLQENDPCSKKGAECCEGSLGCKGGVCK